MAEGLVIPISTPGGEESAAVLDRIADKLEEVGGAAGTSATKMGASANASSAAIGRIATATEKTKTAVERLEESGNRGLHALSEKASELAGSMGGAAGKIADVGLKSLAAFGGIGLQATAAVGAVLMLYNAYQQYETQQRAVTAASEELAAAQTRLGGTYTSLTEAANADGTAEQRVAAIRAASAVIVQEQVATLGRGYTQQETEQITQLSHAIADATRERLGMTAAQVQSVIETGTEAQQQLVLGGAIEHSTNAQVEHANVMVRATRARQHALEVQIEEIHARTRSAQGNRSAIGALQDLRAATAQQSAAQRELATATAATTAAEARAADVTREQEGVRVRALVASDATAAAAAAAARLAAAGRTGGGGPSAQELRAQAEALRMARVANDNALLSASVERQTAQAREHLAFTTRELAFAEASRVDHTRRVTSALQAQSQAQAEYNRSLGAEVAAARARVTAEDAAIESQTALRDAAEASLRTGAAQLRQADARSLSMRRAREDAVAANAAAMGGGETSAESAGISTGESARAAMATEEANATRDLARATQDLAQARREESDASISTEERTTHVTEALARQTSALQRQRTAQAASNAEIARIRTDRMDFLTNSTKGLADGLVQAGLAAAFAGESVGAALQQQLAASLQALAIEAAQKALFATATGLFQLATGNPAAASSFASAATFAAVAVTAGAIGAAVAPAAAPTAPGAAPGARRAGDVTPGGAGGMGGGSSAGPIVNNYYAPIVGGRQSTDAETGVRIDRYNDAARARLRRAA
jgi:hypothetical protein